MLFLYNRRFDLLDHILKGDALQLILSGFHLEEDHLANQDHVEHAGIALVFAVSVAYGNSLQYPLFFHRQPPVLMSTSCPAS